MDGPAETCRTSPKPASALSAWNCLSRLLRYAETVCRTAVICASLWLATSFRSKAGLPFVASTWHSTCSVIMHPLRALDRTFVLQGRTGTVQWEVWL